MAVEYGLATIPTSQVAAKIQRENIQQAFAGIGQANVYLTDDFANTSTHHDIVQRLGDGSAPVTKLEKKLNDELAIRDEISRTMQNLHGFQEEETRRPNAAECNWQEERAVVRLLTAQAVIPPAAAPTNPVAPPRRRRR